MFRKRIGITQKVIKHPRYEETLDCLDMRWGSLLVKLGFLPIPLPNIDFTLVDAQIDALALDGAILSGGNSLSIAVGAEDISSKRDEYEIALLKSCIAKSIPVLGICRGLQLINVYYKGTLSRVKGHAGADYHPLMPGEKDTLFECPKLVNSYHNYGIPRDSLGEDLIPLAYDIDGNIEALRHLNDSVMAIMWHPEREGPSQQNNINLLTRFFDK